MSKRKRIGVGYVTITDVKGWDGKAPTYENMVGDISDAPKLAQLTSGKIKKEDTYTKEEIDQIMEKMVRFDNQTYMLFTPDDSSNKIKFRIRTDGIDNVNMVIKWSKTDYEYETFEIDEDEIVTEREYPDGSQVLLRFTGNVGFQLIDGVLDDVFQWGTTMTKFVYMEGMLSGFKEESLTAQDLCRASYGISLRNLLENATKFNQYLNRWFPRYPGNLSRCFYNCKNFNQSLNNINTTYVTNTSSMFSGCEKFNKPLYRWSMENNYNSSSMFKDCLDFNQDLNEWDVENITNMNSMFENVAMSDKDFSNWNVENVASDKHENFMVTTGTIDNILPTFNED